MPIFLIPVQLSMVPLSFERLWSFPLLYWWMRLKNMLLKFIDNNIFLQFVRLLYALKWDTWWSIIVASSFRCIFGCSWYQSINHVQLSTCELLMLVRSPIVVSILEQLRNVAYEGLSGWLWLLYFLWWVAGDSVIMWLLIRDLWCILNHRQLQKDTFSPCEAMAKMIVFFHI